jgi:hypothetical protein
MHNLLNIVIPAKAGTQQKQNAQPQNQECARYAGILSINETTLTRV